MMSPADHIARLEYVVREQMTVIDQLRAENRRLLGWIMGDEPDALTTLQRIYSDPNTPRGEQNPPVWRFPTNGASPPR